MKAAGPPEDAAAYLMLQLLLQRQEHEKGGLGSLD